MGAGWKNPHKMEAAQKKGQIFTKFAREIAVAAKLGGPDPEGNSRLKLAVQAARAASCPKDTIERAIKKGAGLLDDGSQIEELTYEGQGPFGVGIIIECQTDNKNRTVSELRNILKRFGGSLGESGSVMWMFDRVSLIEGKNSKVTDPEEDAIEVGANSVEKGDDGKYLFYGSANDLDSMRSALSARGWTIETAERSYAAKNMTDLNKEQLKEVRELLEELDDSDDSHRVHATIG
jgi:YebC/PmpR family DNA-binding regulatory protein